jgi:putative spermidine/putrescine transport system ATP-binding protein
MSDRLAVFNDGRIEQVGTPEEVYENPETAFVAGFVGVSNIIEGVHAARFTDGADAIAIRPEKILLAARGEHAPEDDCRQAHGTVRDIQYHGSSTRYVVELGAGVEVQVVAPNRDLSQRMTTGQEVEIRWKPMDVHRLRGPAS